MEEQDQREQVAGYFHNKQIDDEERAKAATQRYYQWLAKRYPHLTDVKEQEQAYAFDRHQEKLKIRREKYRLQRQQELASAAAAKKANEAPPLPPPPPFVQTPIPAPAPTSSSQMGPKPHARKCTRWEPEADPNFLKPEAVLSTHKPKHPPK
jgi:hypothetical protein